ncbi:MAG: MBL fold metallo-hydrolase [Bacteroidota bacterium]
MIHTLDLNFLNSSETIAAFLLKTEKGSILFETGPHSTLPQLEKELAKYDVQLEDIQHVFVTHIHLDHAGAAWAFAKLGAKIYVHPRGQKHLHDPSRLYNSAKRIYQDKMEYLWGTMEGISAEQLQVVEHQEVVKVNGVEIRALHTPGHAVHHIAWQIGDEIITGDVAGVKIGDALVVPPCPPPDIDVEDWQNSIAILKTALPKSLYLTHFGKVKRTLQHLDELEQRLLDWANWMKPHFEKDTPQAEIVPQFQAYVQQELKAAGITKVADLERYEKANPSWMSVAGLMRYWKKKMG